MKNSKIMFAVMSISYQGITVSADDRDDLAIRNVAFVTFDKKKAEDFVTEKNKMRFSSYSTEYEWEEVEIR